MKLAFRSYDIEEYLLLPETISQTWNVKTSLYMEIPRFLIFVLQTGRKNNVLADNSIFYNCKLTNIQVFLNEIVYPYEQLNINFTFNKVALGYHMFYKFQESYYNKEKGKTFVSPSVWKASKTLFIIDCSCQNDSIKSGGIDLRINFQLSDKVPKNTPAFCLILHDCLIDLDLIDGAVRIM